MDWVTFIGIAAAASTTVSFFPQVVKSWRTRKTEDISLWMYAILVFGISLWLAYGTLIRDVPLIAANAVTLVLAGSILYLKVKNRGNR